jgi:hypothetical protein
MIAMGVTEQNDVHIAKPRITATCHRPAGIVEDSNSGGIFKQQGAVVWAQFAGVGP